MTNPNTSGYKSHIERTCTEPRDNSLHAVTIKKIHSAGVNTRVVQLASPVNGSSIKFLPGQWLDVFTSASPKPGGFTITSAPHLALPPKPPTSQSQTEEPYPYVELAVQSSPTNPPAAYFHQSASLLLGQTIHVRVGGSFVWPHGGLSTPLEEVVRYVFIAGGVGINPLVSIVSHLETLGEDELEKVLPALERVEFLYSVKAPSVKSEAGLDAGGILFLERLGRIFADGKGLNGRMGKGEAELKLFVTGLAGLSGDRVISMGGSELKYQTRRISSRDVEVALGPVERRQKTVVYVCGVPGMTDEFVEQCKRADGMREENVLSERWW